ncbi:hypothetical protein GW17_00010437 [Ensete ventricosum]|nr:hypothetical protein GW17_00010437 [Ensete ventricosum]
MRQRLHGSISVLHDERHGQPPARVHLEVAMHEPNTWIVGHEPDRGPSSGGDADGVHVWRIDQVELRRHWVVVAGPVADDVEAVAMQMDGMVLGAHRPRVLQHQLHPASELKHLHPRPVQRLGIVGRAIDEVVVLQWHSGEILGVVAVRVLVVGLQQRNHRLDEGDAVHGRSEDAAVGPPAARVRVGRVALLHGQPDGEQQVGVDDEGNAGFVQASQVVQCEVDGEVVVEGRELGRATRGFGDGAGVAEVPDGGGVLEGDVLGGHEGCHGHVVGVDGLVRLYEDVDGLPRRDHEAVDRERLGVLAVGLDDGQPVVGDGEEVFRVEGRAYQPQQVGLTGNHGDLVDVCRVAEPDQVVMFT